MERTKKMPIHLVETYCIKESEPLQLGCKDFDLIEFFYFINLTNLSLETL